jgi:hypothetical protein
MNPREAGKGQAKQYVPDHATRMKKHTPHAPAEKTKTNHCSIIFIDIQHPTNRSPTQKGGEIQKNENHLAKCSVKLTLPYKVLSYN